MANHLAIGGVSLTLKALLEDRMEFARPGLPANEKVFITISAPDVKHQNVTGPRLNLFLYNLTENGCLMNQEIPGHSHPGEYGHPPLSVNLHYFITSYGPTEQDDVLAHRVLGDAMRVFHDFAIINDALERQRAPAPPPGVPRPPVIDTSLLGEYERIKITFEPLSLEDSSKIWTALPETNFRCSVPYEVSVVQIESRRSRLAPLPVRERQILALPFESPQITEAFRDPPIGGVRSPVAAAGETIRIRGVNLGGPSKRVTLGGSDLTITSRKDAELVATIPATAPAGAHALQVVQDIVFGVTPGLPIEPHGGFRSNTIAFLLIPTIVTPPLAAPAGSTVTMTVSPAVLPTQEVVLLLGDHTIPATARPPGSPPAATVEFVIPDIPVGSYLMRVRVDGAQSRLTSDPITGQYNGPNYSVTL